MSAAGFRWQKRMEMFLTLTPPDDRTVHVVVDTAGNTGKSRFVNHMCIARSMMFGHHSSNQANATIWQGQAACLIDVPRSAGGTIDWATVEQLKGGTLLQAKYEIELRTFAVPHIVVFTSDLPPASLAMLAADRWHILRDCLCDSMTLHDLFPPSRFPSVEALADPFEAEP